jgi:bacillithiol biosynthesis deacetylase BshB1
MKLDILAIAAHPDDAELSCGGTLCRMAERGYRVGILDLTRGEMGTRGDPETRLEEAARAARILGVKLRENLGLPDARLALDEDSKWAVAEKVRAWQPHTVVLPYWQGRHPDHTIASRIGYEACFVAGLRHMPIKGREFRPFKILYATLYDATARPTFAVDITPQFERRKRAILAYRSQFRPPARKRRARVHLPLDRLTEELGLLVRYYGRMIGTHYAEPFVVRELMEVDDVVKLPVRSI